MSSSTEPLSAEVRRELMLALVIERGFIGCNGVHAERGVTNINAPEAEIKRGLEIMEVGK